MENEFVIWQKMSQNSITIVNEERRAESNRLAQEIENVKRERQERLAARTSITSAGYFGSAIEKPYTITDRIVKYLRAENVSFDSIVVTGISGAILGPLVAFATDSHLLFVRKGESTHSHKTVEGKLGKRWIFLDDFVESGATFRRVLRTVRTFCQSQDEFATEFVGCIMYECGFYSQDPKAWNRGWNTAEKALEKWGEERK